MRIERNGVRYFSFGELATSMGLKPVTKVTNDKEKLKDQQEKFVNRHKCKACGQPMTWLQGSSVMTCINPECKGIKFTKEDPETGEKKVWYEPSFDLLDDLGTEIAGNIFSAKI